MKLVLSEVKEVLSRTPGALRALLEGLSESWLEASEGVDTFSPRDVVGHLIHGEKTDWVPRIKLILASGEAKTFVPFDRLSGCHPQQSHSYSSGGVRVAPSIESCLLGGSVFDGC